MALTKVQIVDHINVIEDGSVQVRTRTSVQEDGVEINNSPHRHIIAPGDDYSSEHVRVQAICAAMHTDEIVAAYQAKHARIAAEINLKF